MKDFLKKNLSLVLAFALPVGFITIVVLNVSFSSRSLSTDYNFIYLSCTESRYTLSYPCREYLRRRYSVVDGTLVVNPVDLSQDLQGRGLSLPGAPAPRHEDYPVHIFLHDTKKNESREITVEEAQKLSLNGLLTSPDGFTVSPHLERGGGLFILIFSSGSSQGYYLTKGQNQKRLNLIGNNYETHFISWVLPQSRSAQ